MSGGPATEAGEASTSMTPTPSSVAVKPVIVRVKRKASQARVDAFCELFFLPLCLLYFGLDISVEGEGTSGDNIGVFLGCFCTNRVGD